MSNVSFGLAIIVMSVAVFATRIAGAVFMSRIRPTVKVQRFIEGLSVSVIAALVASSLASSAISSMTAVGVAIVAVSITRSVVWAMFAGMVAAALFPLIVPISR